MGAKVALQAPEYPDTDCSFKRCFAKSAAAKRLVLTSRCCRCSCSDHHSGRLWRASSEMGAFAASLTLRRSMSLEGCAPTRLLRSNPVRSIFPLGDLKYCTSKPSPEAELRDRWVALPPVGGGEREGVVDGVSRFRLDAPDL